MNRYEKEMWYEFVRNLIFILFGIFIIVLIVYVFMWFLMAQVGG